MSDSASDRLMVFIPKALVGGAIAFLAVAGGVYTGNTLNLRHSVKPEELRNDTNLEIGDMFPDYELWEFASEKEIHVSDLSRTGPALLVFVSHNCGACRTMLRQWKKKNFVDELRPDIRVVLVYSDREPEVEQAETALPLAIRVSADREKQRDEDGIMATPTLLALNREGRITFISTGYQRGVDAGFINRNL